MINSTVICGRLTKDVDLRYTPSGVAVANFTVAVDNPFKKDDASFINCVAWKATAENLANYMKKGSMVGVDGRLQTRSFDNQEGKKVFVTEVVANNVAFLESKGGNNQQSNRQNSQQRNDDPFGEPVEYDENQLPF